jgi:hypothetical protein
MRDSGRLLWLTAGLVLGTVIGGLYFGQPKPVEASSDRYEDYIMCTGTVTAAALPAGRGRIASPMDGVWLLDYRSGKLLGTAIDKREGKIHGWAEIDLVTEFNLPPRQNVHFLMATGQVAFNQSALYVAETTTGRFGVYSMSLKPGGDGGLLIRRHDLITFRPVKKN